LTPTSTLKMVLSLFSLPLTHSFFLISSLSFSLSLSYSLRLQCPLT
jgi:hypothetical protein